LQPILPVQTHYAVPWYLIRSNPVNTDGLFTAPLRCRRSAYVRYASLLRLGLQETPSPLSFRFRPDKVLLIFITLYIVRFYPQFVKKDTRYTYKYAGKITRHIRIETSIYIITDKALSKYAFFNGGNTMGGRTLDQFRSRQQARANSTKQTSQSDKNQSTDKDSFTTKSSTPNS